MVVVESGGKRQSDFHWLQQLHMNLLILILGSTVRELHL